MDKNTHIDTKRLIRADNEAWDAFVDRFSPVIYSAVRKVLFAYSANVNNWDISEVVQEVFVRLIKKDYRLLKSYNPSRGSPVTWLTVIARSAAIDYLRRRHPPTIPLEEMASKASVSPKTPALPLEFPTVRLSPRQRLILHLFFDKGMDPSGIAELLNINVQTVRSAKHKAIKKLRKHFKKRE